MLVPLALGAVALVALASALGKSSAVQKALAPSDLRKLDSVIPSRASKTKGRERLAKFTVLTVPWISPKTGKPIIHKKTQKVMTRAEVQESPQSLAAAASTKLGRPVAPSSFALATLIASEVGSGNDLAKAAVAWATVTSSQRRGVSLLKLIAPDGKFGGQLGRYADSRQAPTLRDLEVAEGVLSNQIANPAPGARQWDSPRTQDAMYAKGDLGHKMNSEMVAAERIKDGNREIVLPGVDRGYLRLWAPVGRAVA